MAESNVINTQFKFCDEDDELEVFSVELMYNLMKYFNDDNYALLPKLPRPSKHYSPTVLKSVVLAWHITHENLSRRFRKAFPFMEKNRHQLFAYATCQAAQLFDRMLWFGQLIFLAAYCYELSCFLSKNGLQEHVYVSYTLFSTLWKDQYEADFACIKGWDHMEEALEHYAILLDPLEDIFLPGYQFDFDDMQAVQMEYEIVVKRDKDPSEVPVEEEIRNIFGPLDNRMRRRLVTIEDVQFCNLQYIMNFSTLRFVDVTNVSTPRTLIQYLMHRAITEQRYRGYSALLEEYELDDFEPCLASSDSDDSVLALLNKTDRGQSSLQSLSIRDTSDNIGTEGTSKSQSKDITGEKKATGGKKKKRKKSKAKSSAGAKTSQNDCSGTSTVSGATPKKIIKVESDDKSEKLKQSETSKSSNEKSTEDSSNSTAAKGESPSKGHNKSPK